MPLLSACVAVTAHVFFSLASCQSSPPDSISTVCMTVDVALGFNTLRTRRRIADRDILRCPGATTWTWAKYLQYIPCCPYFPFPTCVWICQWLHLLISFLDDLSRKLLLFHVLPYCPASSASSVFPIQVTSKQLL